MTPTEKVEQLIHRRTLLLLSNREWARLTQYSSRTVAYQTVRRMELGETLPRWETLRALEEALNHFERTR